MNGFIDKETAEARIARLVETIKESGRSFNTIIIVDKVNQYYFTGSMQDAVLIIRADGSYGYFVRRSFARAIDESPLANIYPIRSYRDMLANLPSDLGMVLLETSIMPLAMLSRFQKVFTINHINSVEPYIMKLRMIKSSTELELIRSSGKAHHHLLTEIVPGLLREDMTEAELMADIYAAMIKTGHHGVSRFGMFQMDMVAGQLAFGENSLYPTCFDGPGGMRGMSPAVPGIGSRERRLKKGDLVFADIAFGIDGYHSDKTQIYSFGKSPAADVTAVHSACIEILERVKTQLVPGILPEAIYTSITGNLPQPIRDTFKGFGAGQVHFLGHGVGLQVDEPPVLARGFLEPLAENMVIAVEPKSEIAGVGLVGVEETYIIGSDGAECVTGGPADIIQV